MINICLASRALPEYFVNFSSTYFLLENFLRRDDVIDLQKHFDNLRRKTKLVHLTRARFMYLRQNN